MSDYVWELRNRIGEVLAERDELRQQLAAATERIADLEYQCRHQNYAIGAWMLETEQAVGRELMVRQQLAAMWEREQE